MEVSCGTVWNDCLEVIRINVEEENFNTWFRPIAPLRVDLDQLLEERAGEGVPLRLRQLGRRRKGGEEGNEGKVSNAHVRKWRS